MSKNGAWIRPAKRIVTKSKVAGQQRRSGVLSPRELELLETIAANLRALRRARGLDQYQLAAAADIRQPVVSNIETVKVNTIGLFLLDRLFRQLGSDAAEALVRGKFGHPAVELKDLPARRRKKAS